MSSTNAQAFHAPEFLQHLVPHTVPRFGPGPWPNPLRMPISCLPERPSPFVLFSLIRTTCKWFYLYLLPAIPAAQSQPTPGAPTISESPRPQGKSQKSQEAWVTLGKGDLGQKRDLPSGPQEGFLLQDKGLSSSVFTAQMCLLAPPPLPKSSAPHFFLNLL